MTEKTGGLKDLFGDPWSPPRDPRGRKSHRPTPQGREIVAQLKATGVDDGDIALQVNLSLPTLRKYYFRELDNPSLAKGQVLRKLYAKAMEGNVSAMKAYLAEVAKGDVVEAAYRRRPAAQADGETPARLGKKEQRQNAAEEVGDGMFAPGPAPARLTSH